MTGVQVQSRAGVGSEHQLEARRVGGGAGCAVDHQFAALQGLAQGIQYAAFIFGGFVQEEHATVGPGRGAGARQS